MALASYGFLFLSFLTFSTTKADTDYSSDYLYRNSPDDTIAGSVFQSNLKTLLWRLSNAATNNGFNKTTVPGENPSDSVFGLFMCRGDVPPEPCRECVKKAAQELKQSYSSSHQALIWYNECLVRYSNRSFFSTSTLDTRPSSFQIDVAKISNEESFNRLLFRTMNKTADEAARPISGKKFATENADVSGYQKLYCLAQCTPDLIANDCRSCLDGAIGDLQQCCGGRQGATVLYPSCIVRYELYPFYLSSLPSDSPSNPPPSVPVPASNFSDADSQDSQNPTYLYHNCSTDATADSTFEKDLKTLLSYLSSNATKSFYKDSVDENVYGLFMCRGDLPSQLCQRCVLNATRYLSSHCNSSQEAIIWFSHCMLRYSTTYFFSHVGKSPTFQRLNVTATSTPIPGQDFFTYILSTTLANLAKATGNSKEKYVTKSLKLNDLQTLYTLGQCTQDLSSDDCEGCISDINGRIPWSNLGSVGGRVLYPSCNVRFELFQFYRGPSSINGTSPSPLRQEKQKGQSRTMIFIIVPTIISLALFFFGYYLISSYLIKRKRRKSAKTILREQFGHESVALEPLQFNLAVIEVATNNFSQENRIGRGGFGEVYKGVLDGRQIAVKRLSISSTQGENEFKNEVLSIAKLQHRNLVGFVGFCLEDRDKILIYEYVPNKSLDYYLFDPQRSKLLSWCERYNIIGGIAHGILYLHEHSRLKVIHRDLKPSNILLDENMIPKISDFGLARIVEINQDQGCTNNIAGTHGYMSPEYLFLGQFSDKSDIFSFGVMILEIITGKKNISLDAPNQMVYQLLSDVWRKWNDHATHSILDPSIKENYSETEVIRCIHIGLLSVQPNPNARPTMAEIVSYISSYLIELPSPQEPAFSRLDRQGFTQESSSSQSITGSTSFSINEMSVSEFLPR